MRALVVSTLIKLARTFPDHEQKSDIQELKDSYSFLRRQSDSNSCISTIFKSLEHTCDTLEEQSQARLALGMANCHLARSNKQQYPCDPEQDFAGCTSQMSSDAWNSYTMFFTHVQQCCFYFKTLEWQENTSLLIKGLVEVSAKVRTDLEINSQQVHQLGKATQSLTEQSSVTLRLATETQ